jgi:hypothetical protein
MTASGPGPTPAHRSPLRFDRSRLTLIDVAVAVGAALYVVCLSVPWFRYDGYDLGFGYRSASYSVNGFVSGLLTLAAVLAVSAAAWALLPALADVRVPFPRATVTVALAALIFLLTVVEWLTTFDVGFTLAGLLAVLTSAAVLGLAVLRVLPDLRVGPALPEPPAPHGRPAGPLVDRWPGPDDPPRYGGSWQPPQAGPDPSRRPRQP